MLSDQGFWKLGKHHFEGTKKALSKGVKPLHLARNLTSAHLNDFIQMIMKFFGNGSRFLKFIYQSLENTGKGGNGNARVSTAIKDFRTVLNAQSEQLDISALAKCLDLTLPNSTENCIDTCHKNCPQYSGQSRLPEKQIQSNSSTPYTPTPRRSEIKFVISRITRTRANDSDTV
jgi:hypothetical protein